jgi:ABC-2 type transport system permease protein
MIATTEDSGGPLHAAVPQVTTRSRVWFNPDLRSRNSLSPGHREHHHAGDFVADRHGDRPRERDRHHGAVNGDADPPGGADLGKTLPFVLVGFWDMFLVMIAALLVFHMSVRGQFLLLLFGATLLFLLTTLGAGLFISTVSRTQQQVMMATGLFFQPFFMLSGFTFPSATCR